MLRRSPGQCSQAWPWPRTVLGTAASALAFAFLDVADLFVCLVYDLLDGFRLPCSLPMAKARMLTHPRPPQPGAVLDAAASALAFAVFAFLDAVDWVLCFVYGFLDGLLEESPMGCYCGAAGVRGGARADDEEMSETLYERSSVCRGLAGFLAAAMRRSRRRESKESPAPPCKGRSPRWSDCGCESCGGWRRRDGDGRLHLVVREPAARAATGAEKEHTEVVLFIHGFLSSSSFWTETIFPEATDLKFRMFAVDLLGFGRSPKPANSMYRLQDHVRMIETSAIEPFQLESFHLVSHSMGCVVALALAAKYPARIKSITFVAPPYFLPGEDKASHIALNRLAKKQLWPPLLFGSAVMSWYEHIGRTICLIICRNHLAWEWLFKLLTRKREVDFLLRDLTKHTHHSAWHTMHNVICGGAKQQDKYLEVVRTAGIPVKIIHSDNDPVVPLECSCNMKTKLPPAQLHLISGCDHNTVVVGREKEFFAELKAFWLCSQKQNQHPDMQVTQC